MEFFLRLMLGACLRDAGELSLPVVECTAACRQDLLCTFKDAIRPDKVDTAPAPSSCFRPIPIRLPEG